MFSAAFYKGTRPGLQGIYSRGVRLVEHGPYSHCELIFSDGMSASASYIDGGVRFKRIDFDPEHWDFVDLPDHLESDARKWFKEHEGKAYDLLGNLHFLFALIPASRDKWDCSTAIAAALGFDDPWRFEPNILAAVLRRANYELNFSQTRP